MRIDGKGLLNGVSRGNGRTRSNGTSERFTLEQGESASPQQRAGGGAALSGVDALIALQSVGGPQERGARARHGHEMLDLLESIKIEMLAGAVPAAKLERLADSLGRRPERVSGEPVEEVLDEIEVRARVELAKLGRAA